MQMQSQSHTDGVCSKYSVLVLFFSELFFIAVAL